jgi:uncharacterized protein
MKTTNTLERAFIIIKQIYKEESLDPGLLKSIGIKQQWNIVIGTDQQAGMALNFTGFHSVYGDSDFSGLIKKVHKLIGRSLFDFAEEFIDSKEIQERSLCLCCLNALSQPLLTENRLDKKGIYYSREDRLDYIKPTDVVSIIGWGGMVSQFHGKCREVHVTDLRPPETFETIIIGETIGKGPKDVIFHSAKENRKVISGSDVVLITGSTLVNDTLDELISYAGNCRVVGIYGPSSQLVPEFFFSNGINLTWLMKIKDIKKFEYDTVNHFNMEQAIQANQERLLIHDLQIK